MKLSIHVAAMVITSLLVFDPLWGQSARQNVLLICVDDLRPELRCYGVEQIHSPNIDALASRGMLFRRHYVQAPTCGASRYTLLTGRYGSSGNDALFRRAQSMAVNSASSSDPYATSNIYPSLPSWFRQRGYTTVSVGKVSHHPGGRGGERWDDDSILEMPDSWDRHLLPAGAWGDPRGWMHGLAHGEIRIDAPRGGQVEMDVIQSVEGDDSIYPDGVTVEESLAQLRQLSADAAKPFFLSVGLLRPHLPFGAPRKYRDLYDGIDLPATPHPNRPSGRTTWHRSGEFMKYDRFGRDPNGDPEFAMRVRRHYAACVSYADAHVGRLMAALQQSPAATNTIVVLWGDHGWHLGEHGIWGKHALFEESLRSPLIVVAPTISSAGMASDSVVETIDLFPTLCELAELDIPTYCQGSSLVPILQEPRREGRPAVSYFKKARTIRTTRYRLILHDDGYVELYDHATPALETLNIADRQPETVRRLTTMLRERLP